MQDRLQLLAEHWVSYKFWLIETVGLTNDAMHVHGSLLILCVSALVLRRRPDSLWCWLVVFIAELFNEYADMDEDAILMAESVRQARVIRKPNQIEAVMAGMQKRAGVFAD